MRRHVGRVHKPACRLAALVMERNLRTLRYTNWEVQNVLLIPGESGLIFPFSREKPEVAESSPYIGRPSGWEGARVWFALLGGSRTRLPMSAVAPQSHHHSWRARESGESDSAARNRQISRNHQFDALGSAHRLETRWILTGLLYVRSLARPTDAIHRILHYRGSCRGLQLASIPACMGFVLPTRTGKSPGECTLPSLRMRRCQPGSTPSRILSFLASLPPQDGGIFHNDWPCGKCTHERHVKCRSRRKEPPFVCVTGICKSTGQDDVIKSGMGHRHHARIQLALTLGCRLQQQLSAVFKIAMASAAA